MKCELVTLCRWLLSGLIVLSASGPTRAWDVFEADAFQEQDFERELTEIEQHLIIRGQPPAAQPTDVSFGAGLGLGLGLGLGGLGLNGISELTERATESQTTPSTIVTAQDIALSGNPDVGGSLPTGIRRRSPVAQDPYVRGHGGARLHSIADGVFWTAARADLDSVVSKADPSLVDHVVVLPGPYGLRYGPGFAFIDIGMVQTPRYECGFQAHNRMAWAFRFNGGQIYGTDTVYGGAENYGFSLTYGHRVGSDYRAGDGLRIPSSYNVGNLLGQVGFDWGYDSRVEFRYQYVNEWDTEYAAQFFDINSMVTNAFSLAYTKGQRDDVARIEANAWYHDTGYSGDTGDPNVSDWGKRLERFPVMQRVDDALGVRRSDGAGGQFWFDGFRGATHGSLMSTGARAALILEPVDELRMRFGTDFRLVDQVITESYEMQERTPNGPVGELTTWTTNLPQSTLANPGLYAETTMQWTPYWTTSMGGRFDWAYTAADHPVPPAERSSLKGDLHQSEPLFAAYVTNTVDLTPNWTTHLGVGYAEVVPDLFQRYANGVFLGIIQNGFSRVVGTPSLPKERLLQLDVDVEANYDQFRGRAGFFHGWLFDHATYAVNVIDDPTGARLLRSISTDRASLTGFELFGEYAWLPWLSPFASMRYVRGQDLVIRQPLPQIAPLESTVGVRLEDVEATRPWGLEGGVRMVARQTRAAHFRVVQNPTEFESVEEITRGFTTVYLRGYYSLRPNLNIIGGIENLFDRNYIEHLDLRLPEDPGPEDPNRAFVATRVLSPGVTPFVAVEWTW